MLQTKEKETPITQLERRGATITPFGFMRRFAEDMDRMFEDFQGFRFPTFFNRDFWPFRKEFETFEWMPQIEVLQNNGQFMVKADLPGVTKDNVKVELTEETLTISGERKEEKEEKGEGFFRSERSYGRFYRQVPLPEGVKTENAEAIFRNGVLEITIPVPKAEFPARKLDIKEGGVEKTAAKAATA